MSALLSLGLFARVPGTNLYRGQCLAHEPFCPSSINPFGGCCARFGVVGLPQPSQGGGSGDAVANNAQSATLREYHPNSVRALVGHWMEDL